MSVIRFGEPQCTAGQSVGTPAHRPPVRPPWQPSGGDAAVKPQYGYKKYGYTISSRKLAKRCDELYRTAILANPIAARHIGKNVQQLVALLPDYQTALEKMEDEKLLELGANVDAVFARLVLLVEVAPEGVDVVKLLIECPLGYLAIDESDVRSAALLARERLVNYVHWNDDDAAFSHSLLHMLEDRLRERMRGSNAVESFGAQADELDTELEF